MTINSKKILITGCGGMLGKYVYDHFRKHYNVLATDIDLNEKWLEYLDVTKFKQLEETIKRFQPDYLFHLAAETDLEKCQQHPKQAFKVNALAVKYVAQLSKKYRLTVVYMSTGNVFKGNKDTGYTERDKTAPLNVYGKTKLAGERYIKKYLTRYIIIRAGWMFGGGPKKDKKFVNLIVKQLADSDHGRKEIKVVKTMPSSLTYPLDVARVIERLLIRKKYGTYHLACQGQCTRYELAEFISKQLNFDQVKFRLVDPLYYKNRYFVKRPASERLLSYKLDKLNLYKTDDWHKAVGQYLNSEFKDYHNGKSR